MGNEIHPTAVLGRDVSLGDGNVVGAFTVILGPCEIGDGNWIGPNVAVGTPAQIRASDPTAQETFRGVRIGNRCVIREFATVHQGSERPTTIGDDCYLMAGSHIPHDATLEAEVTLANYAQLGGHTWIGTGATLGLGVVVHQFSTIGGYSMVGMQAAVTQDVPPFALVTGVPAKLRGANRVGLSRMGLEESVEAVERWLAEGARSPTVGLPPIVEAAAAAFDRQRRR
jgi:UDP-N-acetylglucosamine acyltransferase